MVIINNLSMSYDNKSQVLHNVNISFPDKGLICITGNSGCGKTTLLNCIYNNIPFTGSIMIDDINTQNDIYDKIKSNLVSMVYQDYKLLENLTIEQNIRLSCEIVGDIFTQEKLCYLLEKVGLESSISKRKCKKLSGGEKQRVAIARALAQKSKIILADEPTGNLDNKNAIKIFELFKELSSEILIITVTHNRKLASLYGDYQVELKDGLIVKNTINYESILINNERKNSDNNNAIAKTPQDNTLISRVKNKTFVRLSPKSNLALIALPYKNKVLLVGMTIFLVIFMLLACILGSLLSTNQTTLTIHNAKKNKESILQLSSNDILLRGDFIENARLKGACYSFQNSVFINENIPVSDDGSPEANFMKYNDVYEFQNFIECNNVEKIGGTLIAGKNVTEFNEIVINESLAYYLLAIGNFDNKKIDQYADLLGCSLGGFVIVGIIDAQYDRIGNQFASLTRNEFLELTDEEQENAITAKHMLEENNSINTHVLKVGYSEYMRNTYQSINLNTQKLFARLLSKLNYFDFQYEGKDSVEYIDCHGSIVTKPLLENEIVIPTHLINILAPNGKFVEPFDIEIEILNRHKLVVVGHVSQEKVYISSSLAQESVNINAEIFDAINFSSKDKISKNISSFTKSLEKNYFSSYREKFEIVVQTPTSTGVDTLDIFFDSFKSIFITIFVLFSFIAVLFGFTLVYLLKSRTKIELSILRNIGFENKQITLSFFISVSIIVFIAVFALLIGYYALCSLFSILFKLASFSLFDIVFVNVGVWLSISFLLIITMLFSAVLLKNTVIKRKHS